MIQDLLISLNPSSFISKIIQSKYSSIPGSLVKFSTRTKIFQECAHDKELVGVSFLFFLIMLPSLSDVPSSP